MHIANFYYFSLIQGKVRASVSALYFCYETLKSFELVVSVLSCDMLLYVIGDVELEWEETTM